MKKQLLTAICFIIFIVSFARTQYVTISDPGMVTWLTTNYPSAMNGNQMDTTNASILSETYLFVANYGIQNLNGIQYFANADSLTVAGNMTIAPIAAFPPNLTWIQLFNSSISSLPELPTNLEHFTCNGSQITSLPNLPNSLLVLKSINNSLLTSLPELPNNLTEFWSIGSQITQLPELPNSLTFLQCDYNANLTYLPTLPNSLSILVCQSCNLQALPELPSTLTILALENNPNLNCLPLLPDPLYDLDIASTSISCLPNYPSQLTELFGGLPLPPLCQPNNSFGCITSNSISGALFNDTNNNCINTQNLTATATFQLYDGQNNFLQSRSSSTDYNYYFSIQPGEYIVRIDSSFSTNGVSLACPISGQHDITALPDSSYANRDFGFNCLGTELGVEAISHEGIVFPGEPHSVKALAGDLSNYFGLNCASGTDGTVQVSVNGPVTYTGISGNALTPAVSGNSYIYTIADFGTTNIQESFVLDFLTETTAQSGDLVTVSVSIISNGTDLDATNNTLSYSYVVVNSYDPNMKEVNPVDVLLGYEDYFTYTVHFQNLGTAPAFNINIKDTLDSNLDFSTFRVINASHDYSYNLSGDLLTVHFQNIMLADSASDPEGSQGFVQYQVKPKANLPLGTSIENTAHIFFDFNEAVVTNTTINNFVEEVGINEIAWSEFSIYPNPSNGNITIVNQKGGNESLNVEIYDLLGKKMVSESLSFKNGSSNMSLSLAVGTYLISIGDNSQIGRLQIRD